VADINQSDRAELISLLQFAFAEEPRPALRQLVLDRNEEEYYTANPDSLPASNLRLTPSDSHIYEYCAIAGRIYYLPGVLILHLKGELPGEVAELLLADITGDRSGSLGFLNALDKLSEPKRAAVLAVLPYLREIEEEQGF